MKKNIFTNTESYEAALEAGKIHDNTVSIVLTENSWLCADTQVSARSYEEAAKKFADSIADIDDYAGWLEMVEYVGSLGEDHIEFSKGNEYASGFYCGIEKIDDRKFYIYLNLELKIEVKPL